MRPSLRKISINPLSSFSVRIDREEKLNSNWHYHPELELLLIKNASGTSIIADKVEHFNGTYLVLLGPNLPHTFLFEQKGNLNKKSEAIVVHFYENFWGDAFLALPEMKEIKQLLQIARSGLRLSNEGQREIAPLLEKMPDASGLDKMLLLIKILKIAAQKKEYSIIASKGFVYDISDENDIRIKKVYEFTIQNYDREITINEVAELVNLTKESFCRFFKKIARKTYFQFLIEFRIGMACRMLVESNLSIKEIGYSCGYYNLSNFYHQFNKLMGISPLQYQRDYFNLVRESEVA
jgi:AraC-like DNA-binding protein